ncbi:ribonuclease II, chloroplastic/mitochondrial-like [Phoenix dactylifera]|uniref:Ribonuclease II, chloroplastic/mitochondrial-like n=1 Tax=Phoenix dactylifera TaxID=42345 RepID=A0A8B9AX63_PHODC|nr:ribonuclease II, chloroplastic/mitochondrial-like [Phoenix dactylifera]
MKSPMATSAVSGCSLFRSAPPPIVLLSLRIFHSRPSTLCGSLPRFLQDFGWMASSSDMMAGAGAVAPTASSTPSWRSWQKSRQRANSCVYQNGTMSSIRPQQVTYIVPGIEDFDHTNIAEFIQKARHLLDPSILECGWVELLEKKKSVTAKVEELLHRKFVKEASVKELEEFVQLLMSATAMPPRSKPSKSSWTIEEKVKWRIEAHEAYAIDAYRNEEQKKTSGNILNAMGLLTTSSAPVILLLDIGYFPLDLLKFNIHTEHSDEVLSAAESLLMLSSDPDEERSYILETLCN